MYLTYNEYKGLGGGLSETEYAAAEYKARKHIDALTFGRVKVMADEGDVPEAVKMCIFEIVGLENKAGISAQIDNPFVTSYSTDGYTESFGNVPKVTDVENEIDKVLKLYLHGEVDNHDVPLLYRGFDA